ncbi:organic anion transporter 3-like [Amblyomma americanum]
MGDASHCNPSRLYTAGSSFPSTGVPDDEAAGADELEPSDLYGTGCFQLMILLCCQLATFALLTQHLSLLLMSVEVKHWCKQPTDSNATLSDWKALSIPVDKDTGEYSSCTRYEPPLDEFSANRTVAPCQDWGYDPPLRNMLTEWNMVCQRRWLQPFVLSLHMSGAMVAAPMAGHVSDRVGRRPVICASVLILVVSGMAASFASTLSLFLAFRLMMAASATSVQLATFVLLFEAVPPRHRGLYCTVYQFGLVSAAIFLRALSWFSLGRFELSMIVMVPTSLLICCFYMAEESPRWLLATWNMSQAGQVILRVAKINGLALSDTQQRWTRALALAHANRDKVSYLMRTPFLDLAFSPSLRKRMTPLLWCWFALTFSYYSFAYNVLFDAVTDFVYFLAVTLLLPCFYASYLSTKVFGRRSTLSSILVIQGSLAGAIGAMSRMDQKGPASSSLDAALLVLATCTLDASVVVLFTYTAELFPTVVRSVGLGTASMAGRAGGIFAPFVRDLSRGVHPSLPLLLVSASTLLTAVAVRYLPETKCSKAEKTTEGVMRDAVRPPTRSKDVTPRVQSEMWRRAE